MFGVANNAAALWGLKVTATAGNILAAERLWKRHRTAAVVIMVASNAVAAAVAARNVHVLRRLR
jgi:hypothetical protein